MARDDSDDPTSGGRQIEHPGRTDEMQPRPDHGEESYVGRGALSGKRALITGGDSGIGRAVAIAFAREGADVCFSHLPAETDDARATCEWIKRADRTAVAIETDIRDQANCSLLVDRCVAELGGLDIVVNNAAYQMAIESFSDLTTRQLERTIDTNLFAPIWIIQAALEHLSPGSSIINTTSIQASDPSPQLVDYAATKAALLNLTRCLAVEFAERGIRVNAVAPGPIWTPLIPATMPPDKVASFGQDTPLGRPGQPAELAASYVFLASDAGSYVTGEVIAVTGGRIFG